MLVLSGAPHFCAGVEIADHIPEKAVAMLAAIHGFLRALLEFPALTIAKIRGACLGGGAEIALACDFTFAADDAQAGYPEITLSCFPPAAAVLLPPAVGSVRAMDLVCSGRTISGREAAGIGIFTRAVAPVRLDAEVERYLAQILSRSSPALAAVRDLVRLPKRKVFDAGIAESERRYREVARAPELAQAVECFLNRKS